MKYIKAIAGVSVLLLMATLLSVQSQDSGTAYGGGATRTYDVSRWFVAKVGADANTPWGQNTFTNVVRSTAGEIGKVVFVPGAIADSIKIYNASSAANANVTNLVFETAANTPAFGNTPTLSLGQAQIYDLLPGWTCTNGVVTIVTRANTPTATKAYISHDGYK